MIRILVADGMDRDGIIRLQQKGFQITEEHFPPPKLAYEIGNYDALVVRSGTRVDRTIIDRAVEANRLKLIIRAGVGLDNIDVEYATSHGIAIRNTPQASAPSVGELVIGHLFSLARFIGIANVTMRQGLWLKNEYQGIELEGKTLGLIGFGRNAKETARRAHGLGMRIIYYDLFGPVTGYDYCEYFNLVELMGQADFISLHLPYLDQPIIGEQELALMKEGVYLINCARGGLICEQALLKALERGKVAGAALDVFAEEPTANLALLNHPRVSVSPHIGASTIEAQNRIGNEVVEIILEFFARR